MPSLTWEWITFKLGALLDNDWAVTLTRIAKTMVFPN
jgi:hypothetical protein